MNLYFSGIGGIGISALAQYCQTQGHSISGSEISETSITKHLKNLRININTNQESVNITKEIDLFIYTEAVSPNNPERMKASELNIPQKSYFEYLGEITKTKRTIAVAGTHGKTTTVGMIACGLKEAGFDATVFIGSTLPEFNNSNFHAGTNDWLIVEACEYRNNFQYLQPEIIVLTNVEWDHPDHYKSEEEYLQSMENFVLKAEKIITHPQVGISIPSGKLVQTNKTEIPTLSVSGEHNRDNAKLALTLAQELSMITEEAFLLTAFKIGLSNFAGTARRQEYLGAKKGLHFYDDYGHHPTEITVTLQAIREKHPNSKIGLIFEPHQFSRTRQFFDEFINAFSHADILGLYAIYAARDTAEDLEAVSRKTLLKSISGNPRAIDTRDSVLKMMNEMETGDVIIFMGAGKISQFARDTLSSL